MPADIKASAYDWYMHVADEDRIVRFHWEPEGNVIHSSMTTGTVQLQSKVDDDWVVEKFIAELPWVVAQSLTRREGFTVEVPSYS